MPAPNANGPSAAPTPPCRCLICGGDDELWRESVALLGGGGDLNVPVEWVRAPVLLVLATDDELGRDELEQLQRRLRAPLRTGRVDSSDVRLADPDARERAVDVLARTLRRPRTLNTSAAAEARTARAT